MVNPVVPAAVIVTSSTISRVDAKFRVCPFKLGLIAMVSPSVAAPNASRSVPLPLSAADVTVRCGAPGALKLLKSGPRSLGPT